MSWLNLWVSHAGIVSRVGVTRPSLPGGPYTTRFRLDGHSVSYLGKPVLLCDGDRAIVVGWRHAGELRACFLAVPAEGWFFRAHSAAMSFVVGAAMLFLAASVLVKVAILPGLVLAGVATMPIFHAFAWLDGERLMRWAICSEPSRSPWVNPFPWYR